MMEALVIVIVVKDDRDGLDRTCQSLANQTVSCPVVIIDGASTDGSLEVVAKWRSVLDARTLSEVDEGPYAAMAKALSMLDVDDRVWFLNAGDVLNGPQALEDVMRVAMHPDFSWGFGPVVIVEVSGRVRKVTSSAPFCRDKFASGRQAVCHQAVVARVGALRAAGGFDSTFRLASDFKAILSLSQLAVPRQWTTPWVNYMAGGLSDRRIFLTMFEQQRARREIGPNGEQLARSFYLHDAVRLSRLIVQWPMDQAVIRGLLPTDWRSRLRSVVGPGGRGSATLHLGIDQREPRV